MLGTCDSWTPGGFQAIQGQIPCWPAKWNCHVAVLAEGLLNKPHSLLQQKHQRGFLRLTPLNLLGTVLHMQPRLSKENKAFGWHADKSLRTPSSPSMSCGSPPPQGFGMHFGGWGDLAFIDLIVYWSKWPPPLFKKILKKYFSISQEVVETWIKEAIPKAFLPVELVWVWSAYLYHNYIPILTWDYCSISAAEKGLGQFCRSYDFTTGCKTHWQ